MPLTIDNKKVEAFLLLLGQARDIAILSHTNPDGDAVGSTLGLARLLHTHLCIADEHIHVLLPNDCADTFCFLSGYGRLHSADSDWEGCRKAFDSADLVLCLDFNNATRVGRLQDLLQHTTAKKILIDHHMMPDEAMFDLVFSEPHLSSASELVYWLARYAWGEDCLDLESARALYTGITTDTGCFAYSNEDGSTYEAAAAMVRFPIGAAQIHNKVFNTFSVERMRFLAFCLDKRLKIFEDHRFAYIYISKSDFEQFNMDDNATEGFVNYTLMMEKIQVGALVKETGCNVRISFRSKYDFDVNAFARNVFNGGGHVKASGATSPYRFEETLAVLEKNMFEALSK